MSETNAEPTAPGVAELDSGMSKTLHNGLRILEVLAEHPRGLTLNEIAERVGVHRTVAHRLVRTLEAHRLCRRDDVKRISLGTGLVHLSEPVEQDLRTLARPVLEELTERTQATAHLVVQEDEQQVRMLMIVEPRRARMHVSFRPGQVDPIDRGSAGLALLAAAPAREHERDEVRSTRERGFAVSYGEIAPSVTGISALVPGTERPTSLGLSLFEVDDERELGRAVLDAAHRLSTLLR
ncbi:helix-turn-helix domain-containing protein [Saccharopolyspora sp. NFXS83]|uniref:IclR family transcriptional regulator n=1 Tax=Saccharopolyspora sp. NFXS83 TaxID=2993560 RepID=UPI00224B6ED4|nr:helix-turn-helix domain-containing protein [Saccharopolyspora sp. NFXS83]MCX2730552.1 helix-turn-helix domain-containing protein [Saccharopolyspora sp. NFXS83]